MTPGFSNTRAFSGILRLESTMTGTGSKPGTLSRVVREGSSAITVSTPTIMA
ncbi:hypothetical protein D3C87_2107630 [compost metagenome]